VSPGGEGRLRYNNSTLAFEVSVNGGAYTALAVGGAESLAATLAAGNTTGGTNISFTASSGIVIPDNTASAFFIQEGANNYLAITTTDGLESITLGTAPTISQNIFLNTNATIQIGGAQGAVVTTQIDDNVGTAYQVTNPVTGDNYILITTTTGLESMTFGSAPNNPNYSFAGAGQVTINGSLDVVGSATLESGALLKELGADPTTAANQGAIYTKDVAGATQLFYRADSSGTVYQLTPTSGAPALSAVLAVGNTTGGNDIQFTSGDDIVALADGTNFVIRFSAAATAGNGGNLNLSAQTGGATNNGGSVSIFGGTGGATSGDGGALFLNGGNPNGGGAGGRVEINGRSAIGGNNNGGAVIVSAGAATGTGTPGALTLTAGGAGTTGAGANALLTAGAGGSASGNGGQAVVTGGAGTLNANGGDGITSGGAGNGSGNGGTGSLFGGQGGATGAGGDAIVYGGTGGATSGNGGDVVIQGGQTTSGAKGSINIGTRRW